MANHSDYSPSRLKRIIDCPGSVDLIKNLRLTNTIPKEQAPSSYAEHGTMLHDKLASWLKKNHNQVDPELKMEEHNVLKDCLEYAQTVMLGSNVWPRKIEAEASLNLKSSEDIYKNLENKTLSRVNELFFEVRTNQEQVNLYKYSLLPQAEQALKASEVGYLTGKVDFLNLLDSERMVLLIKTGYFKTLSNLGKSLAKLERIVGKDLVGKTENANYLTGIPGR